jgi:hypothetical protein
MLQIGMFEQGASLLYFGLTNDLSMLADQVAHRGIREQARFLRLPTQQSRDRRKRQLLGQQTGPFLYTSRDQDALMTRQEGISRDKV